MELESFRKAKGMSQDELATALGLKSKASIGMIESGFRPAALRLALRIQQFSNGAVSARDLVNAEDRALLDMVSRPRPLDLKGAVLTPELEAAVAAAASPTASS